MSTYEQLLKQQEELAIKVAEARADAISTAFRQIETIIHSNKITNEELQAHFFPAKEKKGRSTKGKQVPMKYQLPTGEQWSGRGNMSKVFAAYLAANKKAKLEDLLINK